MWLWNCELHQLGLRRFSERYWQGERRFGLPDGAYLSVFTHARETDARAGRAGRERVDVAAFHVTFCLGPDRIHFYYHEATEAAWEPGGHTSGPEIRRYGWEPAVLREIGDRVAAEFLTALGLTLLPRGWSKEAEGEEPG